MAEALGTMHMRGKGLLFRLVVAGRPEVSFLPDGITSPGNYGWLFEWIGVILDQDGRRG
jgi:hypothetical protein